MPICLQVNIIDCERVHRIEASTTDEKLCGSLSNKVHFRWFWTLSKPSVIRKHRRRKHSESFQIRRSDRPLCHNFAQFLSSYKCNRCK